MRFNVYVQRPPKPSKTIGEFEARLDLIGQIESDDPLADARNTFRIRWPVLEPIDEPSRPD